jgi:hypothetical protein
VLLDSFEDHKCNSLPIFRVRVVCDGPYLVVASNWPPRVNVSLSDPADFDPSRSSAALWENKFDVHLDTPRDDPVLARNYWLFLGHSGTLIQVTWHVGVGVFRSAPMTFMTPRVHIHPQ